MALVLRVIAVIFAFLVACFAAGLVMTLAVLSMEMENSTGMGAYGAWAAVGFFGFTLSGFGLLPAFAIIVVAESFSIRSVFFYAVVGCAGLLILSYGFGFTDAGTIGGPAHGRDLEIMAAAGIVAGFVYWAIAGRNAGAWHEQQKSEPPSQQDG